MNELPVSYYLVVGLAFFVMGLGKGALGGMLGAFSTVLLAFVMPVDQVLGLMLPLLLLADVFAISFHWRRWNWRLVGLLLPGAIVGITIGTWVITAAPTDTLKLIVGSIVLVFALYRLIEDRLTFSFNYKPRYWHGLFAGSAAGFGSALATSGGPFVSMYLLLQDVPPRMFAASSALFFAVVNLIKVPYYVYAQLIDLGRLAQVAWVIPLPPLGVWVGRWGAERIDKATFQKIVLWLLVVTATLLILR